MKKAKTKKSMNFSISKVAPILLVVGLLIVGLSLVGFGYFLFVRLPEGSIVIKTEQEISDISVNFDAEKSATIFEPNPQLPNITPPNYKTKNPFAPF